jgi:hypothetical protein
MKSLDIVEEVTIFLLFRCVNKKLVIIKTMFSRASLQNSFT